MPCSNQVRFNAAAGHKQVFVKAGEGKSFIGKLKLSPSQLSKLEKLAKRTNTHVSGPSSNKTVSKHAFSCSHLQV